MINGNFNPLLKCATPPIKQIEKVGTLPPCFSMIQVHLQQLFLEMSRGAVSVRRKFQKIRTLSAQPPPLPQIPAYAPAFPGTGSLQLQAEELRHRLTFC